MDLLSALGSGSATGLCGDPVRGVKFGPPETGNTGQLLVISQNWVPDPQIPSSFFHLAICNHEQFEFSVSEFIPYLCCISRLRVEKDLGALELNVKYSFHYLLEINLLLAGHTT